MTGREEALARGRGERGLTTRVGRASRHDPGLDAATPHRPRRGCGRARRPLSPPRGPATPPPGGSAGPAHGPMCGSQGSRYLGSNAAGTALIVCWFRQLTR
jgi:hypothetical protein